MQNIKEELEQLLQQDNRLTADGKLMKNKVVELAHKLDKNLLKLLLSSETIKLHFFEDIDGTLVFDKVKFQDFVNLKEFLADSYTRYKSKIGLQVSGDYLAKSKDVVLVWPYKDCVLEGGQTKDERESRNEIFWNETLAPDEINRLLSPKALTNFKRYDKKGEAPLSGKVDFSKENLIVKGNNLLALHSLKERFAGQVKLIYIDSPYNTGQDSFGYNDSFNHSTWMTFMKNRLEIAKELLKDEGFFCCHIDDHEGQYLKVLLDEIFDRDNFLTVFNVRVRYPNKTLKQDMDFHKEVEHIHIYRRTSKSKPILKEKENTIDKYVYYFNELTDGTEMELGNKKVIVFQSDEYSIEKKKPSKKGRKEIWASGSILDGNSSGRFFRDCLTGRYKNDGYGVAYKVYGVGEEIDGYRYFTGPNKSGATKGKYYQGVPSSQEDGQTSTIPINNYYDLAGSFGNCRTEGGVELRSGKKPEVLLQILLQHFSSPEELVMDYHLGSGTTIAVAHKMGRRFIGVEQLDYGKNDSTVRLNNVVKGDQTGISKDVAWKGGGSFIYCELAKDNARFIDRIEDARNTKALKVIWEAMQKEGFISYRVNESKVFEDDEEGKFSELSLGEQKQVLIRTLDLNQLYVNYSEIDDKRYKVSKEDKELNKQFYKG